MARRRRRGGPRRRSSRRRRSWSLVGVSSAAVPRGRRSVSPPSVSIVAPVHRSTAIVLVVAVASPTPPAAIIVGRRPASPAPPPAVVAVRVVGVVSTTTATRRSAVAPPPPIASIVVSRAVRIALVASPAAAAEYWSDSSAVGQPHRAVASKVTDLAALVARVASTRRLSSVVRVPTRVAALATTLQIVEADLETLLRHRRRRGNCCGCVSKPFLERFSFVKTYPRFQ